MTPSSEAFRVERVAKMGVRASPKNSVASFGSCAGRLSIAKI